jgi:TolB-like protein/cytochrome c-type biogenesis protein CcmH/NrfG
MAHPLPEEPSIAVLPFDNMTGDPEQEYFSDGITDQIIAALSKVSSLFVIARQSTFTYKVKPVKIQQVSEELGVRYVLEGSVQKSGERVRVTAQLIDAIKGNHLWSETYDRELKDIFAVQDDITQNILAALQVELTQGEQARVWAGGTKNLQAYLKLLQAREKMLQMNRENNALAKRLAEEAIALDPDYASAYEYLGATHMMDVWLGSSKSPKDSMKKAMELSKKALALDDTLAGARSRLGFMYAMTGKHDKGVAEAERAVELDPNSAIAHHLLGTTLRFAGRPEEAIPVIKKAIRLEPFAPGAYYFNLGMAYLFAGQCEEAISACEEAIRRASKNLLAHVLATVAYSMCGREEEARTTAAEVLSINPKFSLGKFAKKVTYKNQSDKERFVEALRKAGLPDKTPLPLPDKPSIAVLAFDNMTGDPQQEYLSDGISENIISALSKVSAMFVIARHSTFTYKGKPAKVQQIGRELGVRYIMEGSVQKAGDRLRVTAQLVDATTGNHLWSERYDRGLKDIFAVQDDITKNIITAMQVKLTEGEQARAAARGTNSLEAYLKYMQVNEYFRRFNPESNALAKQLAEEAIALDPDYAWAYFILGRAHMVDVWLTSTRSPKDSIAKSKELAQKALALDDSLAEAYALLAYLFVMTKEHDEAVALAEKAVALNPNSSDLHYRLGKIFTFVSRWEEAILEYKQAIRLDPIPLNYYLWSLGYAYAWTGQYEEAIKWGEKAVRQKPDDLFAHLMLAVVYSFSGRGEDAGVEAAEVLRINPKFSLEKYAKRVTYKNQEDKERFISALRKAGLK